MRGLFLGAGASYDFGLPLVWEFTSEIRNYLTQEKLSKINSIRKSFGNSWNDSVVMQLNNLLRDKSKNYEAIIGFFEDILRKERDAKTREEVHEIHQFLMEIIPGLFLERHVRNLQFSIASISDFGGFKKLAEKNKPLWIFSLNHDLIVEMMAAKFLIPIKSGFSSDYPVFMNNNNRSYKFNFERMSKEDLKNGNFNFFKEGEFGINLVKLHGALDIFKQGDNENFVKLKPDETNPAQCINNLKLMYDLDLSLAENHQVRAVNELTYIDANGEIQFLRKEIISGICKNPPFLPILQNNISAVEELICIGYGFGDGHINKVLKNWLCLSERKKLRVVNPALDGCNDVFKDSIHKIEYAESSSHDFFLGLDPKEMGAINKIFRQIRQNNRKKLLNKLTS